MIGPGDQDRVESEDPMAYGPLGTPGVLLTGATSQLGVFLIPRLVQEKYRVVAVSRRVSGTPDAQANPIWIGPSEMPSAVDADRVGMSPDSIDFLISCGPVELVFSIIKKCNRLRRIVVFSTSSVYSKAASADDSERHQIAEILKNENILKVLCEKAGIDLVILRPTMIYGCGLDHNISRLAGLISRFGWLPLAGAATGLRQPVHADDLAQLAVSALKPKGRLALDSPACGGSTLTYREMVEKIFESQSRTPRILSLPPRLLSWVLGLLTLVRLAGKTNREMIARQNVDLVFDDQEIRNNLDYRPRPFEPTPADFEIPAEANRYQIHPGNR